MSEADILYENGPYWVMQAAGGWFEVYRAGVTHSTRCAQIGKSLGLQRAIQEADRRAAVNTHA